MHGIFEGRAPNPNFQAHSYLAAHPEVAQSGLSPLQHYVLLGYFQKRPVNPTEKAKQSSTPQGTLQELKEENARLLEHLHSAQEELEVYFLKNKTLESEKASLAANNEKLAQQAHERQTALETANKHLTTSKSQTAETEKKLADLQSALQKSKEENALLLGQLHSVQEELEVYFSKNKTLDCEKASLFSNNEELAKLAQERQSALETAEKHLAAAKAQAAETEKKLIEVATERDASIKERDQHKKTASDRASRIAELEAQVSDQAERQKLIDERMIRAETQLEMLKEFVQPAFK